MDARLLTEKIEKEYTISEFSSKIGMHRSTFYRKLSGKTQFTLTEVFKIRNVLKLTKKESDSIFFDSFVA